jgi:hypothetical protein
MVLPPWPLDPNIDPKLQHIKMLVLWGFAHKHGPSGHSASPLWKGWAVNDLDYSYMPKQYEPETEVNHILFDYSKPQNFCKRLSLK